MFVELPPFQRLRTDYFDDEHFRALQNALLAHPEAGDVIEGTGGLRKLRFADPGRQKGTRGGLRVIYFWWEDEQQFWLFTVYDKDTRDDLSADQKQALRERIKLELQARSERRGRKRN